MQLSPTDIQKMTYPDFIGFIGQPNTPPGGERTINEWIELASINSTAFLLDVACSTGFSSRLLSCKTKSRAVGFDISELAIREASRQAQRSACRDLVNYIIADATNLPFRGSSFTHVI